MKKLKSRILSLALAASMVISMVPTTAFAAMVDTNLLEINSVGGN